MKQLFLSSFFDCCFRVAVGILFCCIPSCVGASVHCLYHFFHFLSPLGGFFSGGGHSATIPLTEDSIAKDANNVKCAIHRKLYLYSYTYKCYNIVSF